MHAASLVIFVGLLIFISHLFTGLFERKGIPDVLLLMVVGIIIGPIFGFVSPDDFGILTGIFTSITLVFILFHGGLELQIESIKESIRGTSILTIANFAGTMLSVGLIAWLLLDMEPLASFTLGAILGATSSAVVIPLVSQLKMHSSSRTILVLESALSDVLGIVFVLAFMQAYQEDSIKIGPIIGGILSSFILAGILGMLSALFWSMLLTKVRELENSMFTTPAFVFVVYGVAEQLGYSGAISALTFGITLANIDLFKFQFVRNFRKAGLHAFNESEKQFFSEIVFLLRTFFFVYIGLSIQFSDKWAMLFGFFITVVLFAVRIPIVKFSVKEKLPKIDLGIMATMVPKGLAAAVLASVPMQVGMPGGDMIRNITYAVILISIVLTSALILIFKRVPSVAAFYGALLSSRKYLKEDEEQEPRRPRLLPGLRRRERAKAKDPEGSAGSSAEQEKETTSSPDDEVPTDAESKSKPKEATTTDTEKRESSPTQEAAPPANEEANDDRKSAEAAKSSDGRAGASVPSGEGDTKGEEAGESNISKSAD